MKLIAIVLLSTLAAFVAGEAQLLNPGFLGQPGIARPSSYAFQPQSYGGTPASTFALPNSYFNNLAYGYPNNRFGLQYPYSGYPNAYPGYGPFLSRNNLYPYF